MITGKPYTHKQIMYIHVCMCVYIKRREEQLNKYRKCRNIYMLKYNGNTKLMINLT